MDISTIPAEGIVLGNYKELIRPFARRLIELYVPSDTGDPRFDEIAKDYGGKGTTCGFLCHWLLWRLGCRVKSLVNRDELDAGLAYHDGMNISRIFNNPFFCRFDPNSPYDAPDDCDIVFLSNGDSGSEHVNVHLGVDGDFWHGADAGQPNKDNKQCARLIDRRFVNGSLLHNGVAKKVVGWISLGSVPLTDLATLATP